MYGAGALITAGLGIPAAGYLLLPPKHRGQPQWADAGDLAGLESGSPQQVAFHRTRVDGWKVLNEQASAWVVKQPDGKVTAFAPRCTHLGCAYHWEGRRHEFVCPCHGSRFAADGRVLAGPAPRPLDRYEIKVEGTRVWLGPVENPEAARS
jgi:menaquinol-cytochrome c reductase iron-sulfur subunit